jgi:hypothetical protein
MKREEREILQRKIRAKNERNWDGKKGMKRSKKERNNKTPFFQRMPIN